MKPSLQVAMELGYASGRSIMTNGPYMCRQAVLVGKAASDHSKYQGDRKGVAWRVRRDIRWLPNCYLACRKARKTSACFNNLVECLVKRLQVKSKRLIPNVGRVAWG